jgi:HK97 family phage portal protein
MGRLSEGVSRFSKGLDELLGRPPKAQASGSGIATLLESRSDPPKKNTADFLRAYSETPWLRAIGNRIATGVAKQPWYIEKDGEKIGMEHPMTSILTKGNKTHTGSVILKMTQLHIDLAGDAYWLYGKNALGVPVEAYVIPPHWVDETPSTENGDVYILTLPNSNRIDVPATEMLRFTEVDPYNPYQRGSSTTKALSDEIDTDEYAAKHVKNWFYNRARPDLIIQANDYTTENVHRIERQWLNKHQGFWKAHLPAFLRGQDLKITEIGQTFEQMELVKLRQNERDMMMQVFGISPEIFGVLESSNRATIEAADFLFSKWVVLPRLEFLREVLQERMMPLYDPNLQLGFESPVEEDKDREVQLTKTASWTMTMNEWRERMGMKPIGPEGDVYLIPLNMTLQKNPSEAQEVDDIAASV